MCTCLYVLYVFSESWLLILSFDCNLGFNRFTYNANYMLKKRSIKWNGLIPLKINKSRWRIYFKMLLQTMGWLSELIAGLAGKCTWCLAWWLEFDLGEQSPENWHLISMCMLWHVCDHIHIYIHTYMYTNEKFSRNGKEINFLLQTEQVQR